MKSEIIQSLSEELFIDEKRIEDILGALLKGDKKQIILQGPPGTGKTFIAKKIANQLAERKDNVKIVQFHPSYGYEEFIEGLKPVTNSKGLFEFTTEPGIVLELNKLAVKNPDQKFFLIIDEMNRGNLPKIFGEMMLLLEYRKDKMDEELDVTLQYSNTPFVLEPNIYFIGTMNTADRSIRSIDLALRRRFNFINCDPDINVLTKFYESKDNKNHLGEDLFSNFIKLNEKLEKNLDKHYRIGHSFFMHSDFTKERFNDTWKYQIAPLLDEYFFDDSETRDLKEFQNPFS